MVFKHPALSFLLTVLLLFLLMACNEATSDKSKEPISDTLLYLNHSDTVRYVGMNTCRKCHQNIYDTYIQTGMGQSFSVATHAKSAATFTNSKLYDSFLDLYYHAIWEKDSLYITERRGDEKSPEHFRKTQVNYIVGSGQHTNSHLHLSNGYLSQMPMTYYTQKKHWDLPPGFENGVNTRFSRKIGLECMSCHNAYPGFVAGSENKYSAIPEGIDCERCHGPGSIHVAQRQTISPVDTARYIDYSIVNPAKLSIQAQFDICQRCHLQGNAILKEGKSFYDFKPGLKLSDYMSVFLPKYAGADDEFIMASHADRLKQSACFIKSLPVEQSVSSLKPYKNALTCVTCHNPHVSVRQTNKNVFNEACMRCHANQTVQPNSCERFKLKTSNCVGCHMPVSGSTDIPHVSVHDHYIRRPVTKEEKKKIKTFIGLFAINEENPDLLTRARAYINQYEKFDQDKTYLDSALFLIKKVNNNQKSSAYLIQLFFLKNEYSAVVALVKKCGEQNCKNWFNKTGYDNFYAWTCYRIGESYSYLQDNTNALNWFKLAVQLAPFNLEFRNKLGNSYVGAGLLEQAKKEFEWMNRENPEMVAPYVNLGYMALSENKADLAFGFYKKGLQLDPDNEALLLNLAGYFLYVNDKINAKMYLKRVLKRNPENARALAVFNQLK